MTLWKTDDLTVTRISIERQEFVVREGGLVDVPDAFAEQMRAMPFNFRHALDRPRIEISTQAPEPEPAQPQNGGTVEPAASPAAQTAAAPVEIAPAVQTAPAPAPAASGKGGIDVAALVAAMSHDDLVKLAGMHGISDIGAKSDADLRSMLTTLATEE